MAEVIEHHDGWTDEIEHPGYYCTCGRGFRENNSYGVGAATRVISVVLRSFGRCRSNIATIHPTC